jgi:hypothetical protein
MVQETLFTGKGLMKIKAWSLQLVLYLIVVLGALCDFGGIV